jgi:uncharacterized glyoxalase superfamily protein PhnB
MQVNPYLFYNGNCEAAFKYYEKVLGSGLEEEDHARQDLDRWRSADGE